MKTATCLTLIASLVSSPAIAQDVLVIPSSVEFHAVREGLCRTAHVSILNNGKVSFARPTLVLSGPDEFSLHVKERSCPEEVAPNDSCRVGVRFCPTWSDEYRATLSMDDVHFVEIHGAGSLARQ